MKKIATLTNELSLSFNHRKIFDDYAFYALSIPYNKKDKNYYKRIYTSIKREFNPKARFIRKTSSGHEYILALDNDMSIADTQFNIRKIGLSEIKSISDRGMLSMLLSLMVGKGSFFELTSNPYDIYYTYSIDRNKVIALFIDLKERDRKIYLSLATINFKKVKENTGACYVEENGVLLPYKEDAHKGQTLYKQGNYKSTKTVVPFLGLNSKNFTATKTFFLNLINNDIQEYLSPYVELSFKALDVSIYSDGKDKKNRKKELSILIHNNIEKMKKVHIANLSGDDKYGKSFLKSFKELFGSMLEITFSNNIAQNTPQISITKPKSYYVDNEKEKDPYLSLKSIKAPTQNITLDSKVNKTILNVLMKELALKCELYGYGAFIEHTHYLEGCRYFHIEDKDADIFYKASLLKGSIVTSEPTEEEQKMLESIMFNIPYGEHPESVVMMDENIMLVTKTSMFPLPNFIELSNMYSRDTKNTDFDKNRIIDMVKTYDKYPCSIEALSLALDEIQTKDGIPSVKLMNLSSKVISRGLKSEIEKLVGKPLRFLVRSQKFKSLYAGMLGISYVKSDEETVLYHVGLASGDLNTSIDKNSPYRRVTPIKGQVKLDVLLPFMEEYFVKYNELTISPYPLKYAREAFKIKSRR